jgi:hypothetical protein
VELRGFVDERGFLLFAEERVLRLGFPRLALLRDEFLFVFDLRVVVERLDFDLPWLERCPPRAPPRCAMASEDIQNQATNRIRTGSARLIDLLQV